MLPAIRYRILTDDIAWTVQWLCGSRWIVVHETRSWAAAREWIDGMVAFPL